MFSDSSMTFTGGSHVLHFLPELLLVASLSKPAAEDFSDKTNLSGADALWLPNTERPSWLDGSLPGDRGFDPLGLAKPTEYLQVDCT